MPAAPTPSLLVVEDDLALRSLLKRRFEAAGAEVLTAAGLIDARGILRAVAPVAAVVDIGLEDSNSLDLVAELAMRMLVVVITGNRDLALLRGGLHLGAADVVFKPFDAAELVVRVMARLEARGSGARALGSNAAACLELAPARMLHCSRADRRERLSQREFEALGLLLAANGQPVTRETLSREIYDEPWDPVSRRVDALMSRLRRKLQCELCDAQRALNTVHNVGYRFDGGIRTTRGTAPEIWAPPVQ